MLRLRDRFILLAAHLIPAVLLVPLIVLYHCGKPQEKEELLYLTAALEQNSGQLCLTLHNASTCEVTVCKRNFYDMIECLDVRRFPDTAEFTPEQIFGKRIPGIKRPIITVDDFVKIGIGQDFTIPLDLRCIAAPRKLGDTAFISIFFKNIDPHLCSKVDVKNYDKAIQDYCKLLHVIPTLEHRYWWGEIRTPYLAVNMHAFAPPTIAKKQGKQRRSSKVTILRKSRTHPLKQPVF